MPSPNFPTPPIRLNSKGNASERRLFTDQAELSTKAGKKKSAFCTVRTGKWETWTQKSKGKQKGDIEDSWSKERAVL